METTVPQFASIPGHLSAVTEEKTDEKGKYYVFKEKAEVIEAIYIRSPTRLFGFSKESVARLSWVTVSRTEIILENVNFTGLIQVTAGGKMIAKNCVFRPRKSTSECAVEIFAQSSAQFEGCTFKGSTKAALLVRDRSSAVIENCTFCKNDHSSFLILDSSEATVKSSTFNDAKKFSVYVYRKSSVKFIDSKFQKIPGKGVFVLYEGNTSFQGCSFEECNGGAISLAESSKTNVENCNFIKIHYSAVHGIKDCEVTVKNSHFEVCSGNGVNFEHSNGEVENCTFSDFRFPIFAVFGPTAHPMIHHCTVTKCKTFGAIARDCSTPIFEDLTFTDGDTHCFSISDFARASVRNCRISGFKGSAFNVFNGAKAAVDCNNVGDCTYFADIFTQGFITIRNNIFLNSMKISKRFFGDYKFETNILDGSRAIIDNDIIIRENQNDDEEKQQKENENEKEEKQQKEENEEEKQQNEEENEKEEKQQNEEENDVKEEKQQNEEEDTKEEKQQKEEKFNLHKEVHSHCSCCHKKEFTVSDLPHIEFETFEQVEADNLVDQPDFSSVNSPPIKCLKCGVNDANVYFSPCGHRVLCEQCAEGEKICPLCLTTIQKPVHAFPSDFCLICYGTPDTIILPCGHINVCYSCALRSWREGRKCPECREKMVTFRHIFPMSDEK